jgi:hypothetical protein
MEGSTFAWLSLLDGGRLQNQRTQHLMILIAGPYRSGTDDDPERMAANVRVMESHALPLFRAGHIPVVGEWLALPLVALAGSTRVGDEAFTEVFHPIAERLLEKCDAVLRVVIDGLADPASAGRGIAVLVALTCSLAVGYLVLYAVSGLVPSRASRDE